VFTQCSKCETVFRLSAEVLRAAGGQVRCGKCGEVFNALAHLAEDASAFVTGESAFELESRADRILQTPVAAPPSRPAPQGSEDFVPPGVEIARLQILDWSGDELLDAGAAAPEDLAPEVLGETSMEFTLPPGELDRIFVESKTRKRAPQEQDAAAEPVPQQQAAQPDEDSDVLLDVEVISDNRTAASGGFEVSEVVRREMLLGLEPPLQPLGPTRQPLDRSFIVWLTAAVACALLLGAQIVHQNREWLSVHAPFSTALRNVYSKLGAAIPQPANLSDYQLRQWGVTGDPAADGTLRVRASILNTAAQPEPYPLLRVTLANRFGSSIGSRDFEPAEYVGKPLTRLLAPGERVDATMDILDPGKSAEGFEIDVCLRSADKKISCANDAAAPQAKR
jgi:predicted Zn finger-like uncharacterized protein